MYGQFPAQNGGYSELITANTFTAGGSWRTWQKPRGIRWFSFLLVGAGGGGGSGVVGANSVSAGGGGGGSGGQIGFVINADLLPDILYFSLAIGDAGAGVASRIAIRPDTNSNHCLLLANGGGVGGNAAAGVGGTAGSGATVSTVALANLSALGVYFNNLAGQPGIIGGAATNGASLTVPFTGLIVTAGTGGGGLPAAAAAGSNGGNFTVPTGGAFPAHSGGVGPVVGSPTVPPAIGANGYGNFNGMKFNYGGTGGGSTHGTATGAGLVQARGGDGAPGCGGGGMGGALTGSTPAVVSKGGSAFCLISG